MGDEQRLSADALITLARQQFEAATDFTIAVAEEFADRFMREYLPRQKPTERKSKEYILRGSILPFFGAMRLDEIDQPHVNAFIATQAVATKTLNNRLSVLATMLSYAGPTSNAQ